MFNKYIFIIFLLIILVIFSFYAYLRYSSIELNQLKHLDKNENLNKTQIVVSTNVGSFVGNLVNFQNKKVAVFLGIPYALPPIDSLRFRKPVPVLESNQTFDANLWPNPCLQKDNHLRLNSYNFSEDCLYLNVWNAWNAWNANTSHPKLKPVLVHIHTGAFLFGSASESTYNGIVLSALGDVVVVTFNYRLNLFGFLYTGTDRVVQNAGMYDQVLALNWVNQNIGQFGGDPSRVTLLGQSTGSLSVGLHIMSPITQNLFRNAVMISGSPLQHQWLSEPETAKQFWIKFSKEVNCLKNETFITDKVLECLTQLNRNQFPSMTDTKRYSDDPFVVSAPVVFDEFKPRNLLQISIDRNISLLFGYTDDEGSWMLALEDRARYGPQVAQNMTFDEAVLELTKFVNYIKSNFDHQIDAKRISNYYFNSIPNERKNDKNLLSRTIGIALGDYYIGCSLHHFADYLFKINSNSKIYQYLWSYKGDPKTSSFWRTFEDVWCGKWMGSCHSFELYSLFGVPFLQSFAFNDIDRKISLQMIKTISYFAYNNKPMSSGKNEWLQFYKMNKDIIKPFYVIGYDWNSRKSRQSLKKYECDSVWKQSLINWK